MGALSAFFGLIAKAIGNAIVGAFEKWQQSRNDQKLGRAEGAVETSQVIAEKIDDQAKVNAADRGDKDDVADRLAARLGRVRDGSAGSGRQS